MSTENEAAAPRRRQQVVAVARDTTSHEGKRKALLEKLERASIRDALVAMKDGGGPSAALEALKVAEAARMVREGHPLPSYATRQLDSPEE